MTARCTATQVCQFTAPAMVDSTSMTMQTNQFTFAHCATPRGLLPMSSPTMPTNGTNASRNRIVAYDRRIAANARFMIVEKNSPIAAVCRATVAARQTAATICSSSTPPSRRVSARTGRLRPMSVSATSRRLKSLPERTCHAVIGVISSTSSVRPSRSEEMAVDVSTGPMTAIAIVLKQRKQAKKSVPSCACACARAATPPWPPYERVDVHAASSARSSPAR